MYIICSYNVTVRGVIVFCLKVLFERFGLKKASYNMNHLKEINMSYWKHWFNNQDWVRR